MRRAQKQEKSKVIKLLLPAFLDVPGLKWVTGNDPHHPQKLYTLLDCAVEIGLHQGEIWISDDETAVTILFYQENRKTDWFILLQQARMALKVIGLGRVPEIAKREKFIHNVQNAITKPAIYVWFIAATRDKTDMNGIVEIKNELFKKADREHRVILMETTLAQNAAVFKRIGFEEYHKWKPEDRDVTVWFLQRKPSYSAELVLA